MSSFANTFHQQLLIDGYFRKETEKLISVDILNVIMLFCNEAFKWSFKGSEWTEFLNAKNGKAIYGPLFNINDIIFNVVFVQIDLKHTKQIKLNFGLKLNIYQQIY